MSTMKTLFLAVAAVSAFAGCTTAPMPRLLPGVSVGNLTATYAADCPRTANPPPSVCFSDQDKKIELAPIGLTL
jgi:hypothetical protein